MKAVTLQKEGIKVVDTSVPTPNDFQVLVKVHACGLNRSDFNDTWDLKCGVKSLLLIKCGWTLAHQGNLGKIIYE